MAESAWRLSFEGTNIAVLAGCHVRRGGPPLPDALRARLAGADLIVTLGGMGARRALDELGEIAPVLGVRGIDDEDDPRTRHVALLLEGDGYRLGCVSDARAAGLARRLDPFVEAEDAEAACRRLFGGPVHLLLHAGANEADEARFGAGYALSPGRPTDPAPNSRPTFLRLKVGREGCYGQTIWVA